MADTEQMLEQARTDPATARSVLELLTRNCRTLNGFEQRRGNLFGAGIPASFLPGAAELGRTHLT